MLLQLYFQGGAGAGSAGEGTPGRQRYQGHHSRGRRRQRKCRSPEISQLQQQARYVAEWPTDCLKLDVVVAGREDRLQRVRGDDEEREPGDPQEATRRRAIGGGDRSSKLTVHRQQQAASDRVPLAAGLSRSTDWVARVLELQGMVRRTVGVRVASSC